MATARQSARVLASAAKPAAAAPRPSPLPLFLAALLIPAVLGSSKTIFNDGDLGWHIATGQWILDHRAIPHTDPFSFTFGGKPWVPIEWLAEVFYAAAYRLAGYSGVAALATAALIGLHAIVFAAAKRGWGMVAAIVLMDVVLIPMMLARPHLLAWPLIAGWTWLMLRAREEDRAPPLAAALLLIVWANLHGSFVMGLAIAGFFGLEALLLSADKVRALRQWLLFGALCGAAIFVNGNGLDGVLHPLTLMQSRNLVLIDEWKPSSVHMTPYFFVTLALVAALIAWRLPRLPWTRWLLLAILLGLALLQMRHQSVLAIVGAMVLPRGFSRDRGPADEPLGLWAVAAAAAAFLIGVRAIMPLDPPHNEANPWHLIAAVPSELRHQPVLNGYSMGGPLILAGIRPYIDGRSDLYGDPFVIDYSHIIRGDTGAFDAAVGRWNIRWAILPIQSKLVPVIDRNPGWRRITRDSVGAIYVKAE